MVEIRSLAASCSGVQTECKGSYKKDLAPPAAREPENDLVARVAQARARGLSYGNYMAMLKDGIVEDPLAGGNK